MANNNFKPFGIGNGANVTNQADYEALAALLSGFTAGKASSAQVNKALRQGTVMASVLAQFIANTTALDVLDNGDTDTLLTNFLAALKKNSAGSFLQTSNNLSEIAAAGTAAQTSARASILAAALAGLATQTFNVATATANSHAVPLLQMSNALSSQSVGRLLNIQIFTASGTYIPTNGTTKIRVKQVGGGGAGGGTLSTSSVQIASGNGGNGGTYGDTGLMAVPTSNVAVIVGSAGVAVVGGNGGSGGNTSFGSYLISPGGGGGGAGAAGGAGTLASDNISNLISTGTNVSISLPGDKGTGAFNISVQSNGIKSGGGGDSQFGIGGGGINGTTSPRVGVGYGAGGSGNAAGPGAASNIAGANGTSGIVIVEEYA